MRRWAAIMDYRVGILAKGVAAIAACLVLAAFPPVSTGAYVQPQLQDRTGAQLRVGLTVDQVKVASATVRLRLKRPLPAGTRIYARIIGEGIVTARRVSSRTIIVYVPRRAIAGNAQLSLRITS